MTENEAPPDVVMPHCPHRDLLRGQKALVTGASSGIDKSVAIYLAQEGVAVAVNYVGGEDAANAVVAIIKSKGGNAIAIRADVSQEAQVQAMFRQMFDAFGTIDILVNNAGLQQDAPFDEMTLAQWRKVIDVNLTGQFLWLTVTPRQSSRKHYAEYLYEPPVRQAGSSQRSTLHSLRL